MDAVGAVGGKNTAHRALDTPERCPQASTGFITELPGDGRAQTFLQNLTYTTRGRLGDTWHLDEVFVTIQGRQQYLWRAVEQWIKEGKQAAHWTRLSCHRFRANEVRLQLSVLTYNLGNLWRRLVLPARIATWSLTSLQQRLVKTGGRLVKHARYYWLLLAESHLTRRLFGAMLQRIWALPVPAG